MVVYTSYFYQIRFFKPYMIPISTAAFDPKWFHNSSGNNYNFLDKNGVINGIRLKQFAPAPELCNYCSKTCPHRGKDYVCEFLQKYYKQISKYPIASVKSWLENVCSDAKHKLQCKEEPIPVFIVYETPDNKCSERRCIQDYFNNNGVECKELEYPIK